MSSHKFRGNDASSLLLTAYVFAADVSGKWTADVAGRNGQTQATTFVFKVEGEKLTGTVSGRAGENAISDGTVKGDEGAGVPALEFTAKRVK